MTESVAELLGRLRFVKAPVESLYLNEDRAGDHFTGQLGAIDSFTRTAAKEGKFGAGVPVLNLSGGASAESGVTWTLREPITQVLLLHAALESQGLLYGLDSTALGRYISFAGVGFISRPGMFDREHWEGLREHPGLYEELEAKRASAEQVSRIMKPDSSRWLLTVSEGSSVCAAILDNRWLKPASQHWMGPEYRWEIFGLFRQLHKTGVPLLAAIHISMKWPRESHGAPVRPQS
jgi:hypothetical protein